MENHDRAARAICVIFLCRKETMFRGVNLFRRIQSKRGLLSAGMFFIIFVFMGLLVWRMKTQTYVYQRFNQENIPNISNIEVTGTSFKITTYRSTDMSVVDSFEILRKKEEPSTEPTELSAEPTEPSGSSWCGSGRSDGSDEKERTVNPQYKNKTGRRRLKCRPEKRTLTGRSIFGSRVLFHFRGKFVR